MPPRTKLDELLEKAETPEDVLLAWEEHGGIGNNAAIAMVKWAQLVQKTKGKFMSQQQDLMNDQRLLGMMDTISAEVRKSGPE